MPCTFCMWIRFELHSGPREHLPRLLCCEGHFLGMNGARAGRPHTFGLASVQALPDLPRETVFNHPLQRKK